MGEEVGMNNVALAVQFIHKPSTSYCVQDCIDIMYSKRLIYFKQNIETTIAIYLANVPSTCIRSVYTNQIYLVS